MSARRSIDRLTYFKFVAVQLVNKDIKSQRKQRGRKN